MTSGGCAYALNSPHWAAWGISVVVLPSYSTVTKQKGNTLTVNKKAVMGPLSFWQTRVSLTCYRLKPGAKIFISRVDEECRPDFAKRQ
jgi:hypothetical protein